MELEKNCLFKMGGSRNRSRQKKVEKTSQTFRDELIQVKETIAGLQIKLENSIKSNENLRFLNTLLVNDLKMEQELQVRNFSNQCALFLDKKLQQTVGNVFKIFCSIQLSLKYPT